MSEEPAADVQTSEDEPQKALTPAEATERLLAGHKARVAADVIAARAAGTSSPTSATELSNIFKLEQALENRKQVERLRELTRRPKPTNVTTLPKRRNTTRRKK